MAENNTNKMELMSPAGNLNSFIAAIEGGADSVYLGYLKFNARRPADNFDAVLLRKITKFAHSLGKKIYITLNIDLKSSELAEATRLIEFIKEIGIDAVIVKDLGLIELLRKNYKGKVEYHASTQTAISSSDGAVFAEKLGFSRIVLARELDVHEIKAITSRINIETEIFVEGSMCFSVSGRCLMSSWVGGRSGNRGGCTAPCRLSWENNGNKLTYFSMKDMLLVTRLKEIEESGVDSLKIEGRLKSYGWVNAITSTYRHALDCMEEKEKIEEFKEALKQFSARETGEGHFFGHTNLIGKNEDWESYKKGAAVELKTDPRLFQSDIRIVIETQEKNLNVVISCDSEKAELTFSKPQLPKKGRAGCYADIKAEINQNEEFKNAVVEIDQPENEGSSNQISKIAGDITAKLKLIRKKLNELPELPLEIKNSVDYKYSEMKRSKLVGTSPDKVIIEPSQAGLFLNEKISSIKTVVVEVFPGVESEKLVRIKNNYELILSLPHVIYEKDLAGYKNLIAKMIDAGITKFEANSFTGLELLSHFKCEKTAGFGLPVLNHLAAEFLYNEGCDSVYASFEAESGVMESLSKTVRGKIEFLVFARLPLFISRVEDNMGEDKLFKDKIGTEIECRKVGGVYHFLSKKYFGLFGETVKKAEITADSLTADLRHTKNTAEIIRHLAKCSFNEKEFSLFNFSGKLV